MSFLLYLFWISLCILFYCYFGYGMIVFIMNGIRSLLISRKQALDTVEWMPVTLIISAYNEGDILHRKILNTLAIDYPDDKLTIIFVTDGSIDHSAGVIGQFPSIRLLHQPERKGKYAAIKRAMQFVHTPIVVFSDANAMLNKDCLKKIVPHYRNNKVGGVAGEKKIIKDRHVSAVGEAEGLYWQYESVMKKLDAGFYSIVGAAGELFSIRTGLFKVLGDDIILDDFITSMQVCLQGYKIEYEPGAFASEPPSASLADEQKRKLRISAGAYQSIRYVRKCLNVFKYPALSFQFISRRLLRWVVCPLVIVTLLLSNIIIVVNYNASSFYTIFLFAQVLFYVLAITGWLIVRSGRRAGLLTIPFYFVFMNYCLAGGFTRFIRKKQTVLWEKSLRQAVE